MFVNILYFQRLEEEARIQSVQSYRNKPPIAPKYQEPLKK